MGVDDPLTAYQFDAAVFALDEAIEGALAREHNKLDMSDLDQKAKAKVRVRERAIERLLDRIMGRTAKRRAVEAARVKRPVEYVWDEASKSFTWRYLDEVSGA